MSELIDRQSFIENERKLYCEDCDRRKGTKNGKPNVICYEIGEAPCRACWLDDALTDLEDFPAASPWHRVEEPPKEEGKYLVYDGRGNYHVAWWGQRLGWCYDPKFFRYWMPIEPPKEDGGSHDKKGT